MMTPTHITEGSILANGESGILRLWDQRPVRISSYA